MEKKEEDDDESLGPHSSASSCWFSKKETLDALPANVRKLLCIPCQSFESKLLLESKLSPESDEYAVLKKVLFQHLTFVERRVEGKLHAIVAGSYPTYLGRAVKKYGDVDVFIIANDVDLVRNLLRLLHPGTHLWRYPAHITNDEKDNNRHWEAYGDVISVKTFGKVQLIFQHHYVACLCDFHLNASYFRDFHHCTRWRLDVFENFFLVRYMPLERKRRDPDIIICAGTAIFFKNTWTRGDIFKTYPYKHMNNVSDFGPPKLSQQALHVVLKKK